MTVLDMLKHGSIMDVIRSLCVKIQCRFFKYMFMVCSSLRLFVGSALKGGKYSY